MTISSSSSSYLDVAPVVAQRTSAISGASSFSTALADGDSVNISSAATPASLLLDYGTTNPQIIAYDEKMASDTTPGFTLFSNTLTTTDKEMLSQLQGGGWADNGPANHLVDQIATARGDGSLQGPITASFIQNIIAKQGATDKLNPNQVEIPLSTLNAALSWISTQAPAESS